MESFSTECALSGTLSVILYISWMAGVAPLSFESFQDRWKIRISKTASLYGKIITTSFYICAIISVVFSLVMDFNETHPRSRAGRVVNAFSLILLGPVVLIASYNGVKRLTHFINYYTQLEKINMELINEHRGTAPSPWQLMSTVVFFLFVGNLTVFSDYALFMYEAVNNGAPLQWLSADIFYSLVIVVSQLVTIQFSMISYTVLTSYRLFNECLKKFLLNLSRDSVIRNHLNGYNQKPKQVLNELSNELMLVQQDTASATVHRLTFLYCSLCDIVGSVNDSHGALLIQMLPSCLLYLVISPYHFLNSLSFQTTNEGYYAALSFLWVVFQFSNLTFIVEPCHQTHEEMELTKTLVSKLMLYAPASQESLNAELLQFYRFLKLNESSYSPLGMFALSRGLVMTILASVTTYLVVVVTF